MAAVYDPHTEVLTGFPLAKTGKGGRAVPLARGTFVRVRRQVALRTVKQRKRRTTFVTGRIPFCIRWGACYKTRPFRRAGTGGSAINLNFMSQHSSLRGTSSLAAKRNVLKRFERVAVLKRRGQWKEGDRVISLRKTKPEA